MKYLGFRKKIPYPFFTKQDLRLGRLRVFDYQLSLWQKRNYLIKLKNGLYVFEDELNNIAPEEMADKLYAPSYISLEKALFAYGIIPEVVYSITSVTPKITRRFKTRLGEFVYRHIKPSLFFGYKQQGKTIPYLMAELEKAILDFLYFNMSRIKTKDDLFGLRFNNEVLKKEISLKKFKQYLNRFHSERLKQIASWLWEE